MSQRQLDTVRTYLQHLHASHTAGLISTFEDDGVVHSPFLGTMTARDFFPKLAQASSRSVITLIDLFASVQPADDAVRVAAYFRYDWTLSDGRPVDFTCVDVFAFRPGQRPHRQHAHRLRHAPAARTGGRQVRAEPSHAAVTTPEQTRQQLAHPHQRRVGIEAPAPVQRDREVAQRQARLDQRVAATGSESPARSPSASPRRGRCCARWRQCEEMRGRQRRRSSSRSKCRMRSVSACERTATYSSLASS
jgi:hypothetical protein